MNGLVAGHHLGPLRPAGGKLAGAGFRRGRPAILEVLGLRGRFLGRYRDWRYEVWPQTSDFGSVAPARAGVNRREMPAVRLNYDCTLQKALLALASDSREVKEKG